VRIVRSGSIEVNPGVSDAYASGGRDNITVVVVRVD
jgi:hypothetical protein